jgi:hypothetical protein
MTAAVVNELGEPPRYQDFAESAGKTITLPGATLRSIDSHLTGGGFGSVPLMRVFEAIPAIFELVAAGTLKVAVDAVPLTDVVFCLEPQRVRKARRIYDLNTPESEAYTEK